MSINAWANDQGALFAVPMTSAMPPDPSDGSWILQWDPILRQLKYAPFVPPAPEFDLPVPYVGGLAMTVQNQTVEYAGTVYAPVLGTLPFITTGIWATDSAKFRVIQGVTLAEVQALLVPKANLDSPVFTGVPTTPTPAASDNSTQVVNSSWIRAAMGNIATAAGFQISLGASGYIAFPSWFGGAVFQWVTMTNTDNLGVGFSSVAWPVTYSTVCHWSGITPFTSLEKSYSMGAANIVSGSATVSGVQWVAYNGTAVESRGAGWLQVTIFSVGK